MTSRVVTSRSADADIEAIVDYYSATAGEDVALRFVDVLAVATERLMVYPQSGSARPEAQTGVPGLRSVGIPGFPHVLFYTVDDDAVRVHRVLHHRGDVGREFAP